MSELNNPNPHAGKPHPAAPLTEATRPFYEAIEVQRRCQCDGAQSEIARLTQGIWDITRKGYTMIKVKPDEN